MIVNIEIKIELGRVTMNGKSYPELNEIEKRFMNDLLKTLKLEAETTENDFIKLNNLKTVNL